MNPRSLLALSPGRPIEIKIQSKEQFFSTKRSVKRLKGSLCSIGKLQSMHTNHADQSFGKTQHSVLSLQTEATETKAPSQQLASTFGSEVILSFKVKQPKRKKNKILLDRRQVPVEEDFQSDGQVQNKIIRRRNSRQKSPISKFNLIKNKEQKQIKQHLSVDSFIFVDKIGQGTYSCVFKVIEIKTGFVCALKVLSKQKMRRLNVEENVLRQIKIQFYLQHPNIAKLYGCFSDQSCIYLICELATDKNIFQTYMKGMNPGIKNKIKKGVPAKTVARIMKQLVQAVKFMHQKHIIHRDIKPQNILLSFDRTVKLCDFGWSVHSPPHCLRSTLCGTPLYLAPQLIKQTDYDNSVDVWALGVLTYELLTEEMPFKVNSLRDLSKVLSDDINFEKINCILAQDFIRTALVKDRDQRGSINELSIHEFLVFFGEEQDFCF